MQTQTLRATADQDGIVKLQLPRETANQELELVIVFQPAPSLERPANTDAPETRGWHPDFFTQVVGSWQGEEIERPPQLPWEDREELYFWRS